MERTCQGSDDAENISVVQGQARAARSITQKENAEEADDDASDDDGGYPGPEQQQIENRHDDEGQAGEKRGSG